MTEEVLAEPLSNRVVCMGIAALDAAGETPAAAPAVRRTCREYEDALAEAVVETLDEATVARALNELDDAGHVARVDADDTSPVGKGRPEFALVADAAATLDALARDDALAAAVDAVRTVE